MSPSALRPSGAKVKGMGGTSSGPLALMEMVNEAARHIMSGGNRRAALWLLSPVGDWTGSGDGQVGAYAEAIDTYIRWLRSDTRQNLRGLGADFLG